MRLALLSDIHANLESLTACLAHARSKGADRFAFLGDYVGYGADAHAVVEMIERYASHGAIVIKGNHDDAVETDAPYMNRSAKAAIDWARQTLNATQKRFLASLPMIARDRDMCFVHASAEAPQRWRYVDSAGAAAASSAAAQATYTFCGHMHEQRLYFQIGQQKMRSFSPIASSPIPVHEKRRWLAIVGSAGQPRDANPAAGYALFDPNLKLLTFFRVPYDHLQAAAKIRRAGLPEFLAHRLETGA